MFILLIYDRFSTIGVLVATDAVFGFCGIIVLLWRRVVRYLHLFTFLLRYYGGSTIQFIFVSCVGYTNGTVIRGKSRMSFNTKLGSA